MNIGSASETIRQTQAGRFRRPGDGQEPFAHIKDSRLESAKEQKSQSVFVNSQKTVTFKKEVSKSDFPRLFDHDAGTKFTVERIAETKKKDSSQEQYESSGKKKNQNKQNTSIVDEWA